MGFGIRIAKKEHFYNLLENLHKLDGEGEDPAEDWKKTPDENVDKLKRSYGLNFQPAELPYPLSHVKLYLGREDSCFSAYLIIHPRDLNIFNGLSDRLERDFKGAGKIFSPTTSYGTGYIIDKDGNIRASIMDCGQNCLGRDIGIGCNGAKTRKFDTLKRFSRGLGELERAANTFLHSIYAPFVKGEFVRLPETTVYLNP